MAIPCTRTYRDDVTDALEMLERAERELANWRAHLNALDPTAPGHAHAAAGSARIVQALVNEAVCATRNAAGQVPSIA
jgi:hypothetical protein